MIIDYAYPTMMAEKALKEVHQAMLEKNPELALKKALEGIQLCTDVYVSIRLMEIENVGKAPARS